ncbi:MULTISPECIES: acyl-CoA dehydrogenase family protein [Pseudonocardia]|uniref:acyl-CoA dehydrogenase family protein n=1 Tax=Pseudonocardia TaxID=1847 RepID=UPI00091CD8CC|nr:MULTISPECIES: acyl-CoA dehydrogenase family protein [unclassified Pseudonocardia]MCM3849071.1 acyl-CoA dehydrogenase family protein [Pseudonocardia sp. DR1-2]MCO7192747.1 acyl-CoA dehydrogenase family protein [Pseudonocardia sp. McavD-2-B]MYW73288.1 acyl-CoA dehydrogenase [Pseudonocardia sp. SID8383]OJG04910.1 (R)-benzylsuccinyl-CoA dehydrogenase [Pseudonocardia autotrophica]
MTPTAPPSRAELEEFRRTARAWVAGHLPPRRERHDRSVAVFHDLPHEQERALIARVQDWTRTRYDAGYGALTWAVEDGGAGLSDLHEEVFAEVEREFETPGQHELTSVSTALVAPTVRLFGTPAQRELLVTPLLRGDELACQLFSEPSAGSDLAGLGTRAVREGDGWVVNGQKVWSSGAQFAGWGELICRTDPDAVKHRGLTAFLLPMDTPGVEVRPLRQMSGGTSFCEVFLDDVRIPDTLRLGEVGGGWGVTLATLGFERGHSGANADLGGGFADLLGDARALGRTDDPDVRRILGEVWVAERIAELSAQRDREARLAGTDVGAVGSLRKLVWAQRLALVSDAAAQVLGPRLVADAGDGTHRWVEHVLGAPGYRIAGGSDEVQRTIIAERLLGLPPEPRADRGVAWKDVPR